jgi:hypothetical protein
MSNIRKLLRRILLIAGAVFCAGLLLMGGWIVITYRQARLNLSVTDDLYTASKSIALVPASGEIYVTGVGWVDPTVFYQARVTSDEVSWLEKVPEVSAFSAPGHAPLWWRFWLWWDATMGGDMKYYRTEAKWPCIFAHSRKQGRVYGTVEFD